MGPYLISFTISVVIIAIIGHWNTHSVGFIFWSFVALMIPCLLAGLRANNIGTDVMVYARPLFDLANCNISYPDYLTLHWWSVWRETGPSEIEPGFTFLVWLLTQLTHSFPVILFMIQALTIVPIYLGLVRFKNDIQPCLGIAVYYLMFYNVTLNNMRQWIAISFLLYGFRYLYENKFGRYIMLILISSLFHMSGLLGIIVLFVYKFLTKGSGEYKRVAIVALVAFALLLVISPITSLLAAVGLSKYTGYLGEVSFLPNQLILRLPCFLVLLFYAWRAEQEHDTNNRRRVIFFLGMMLVDLAVSQLASANEYSGRIAYYFGAYLVYSLPYACARVKSKASSLVLNAGVVAYLLVYWVSYYVLMGVTETVPYISTFF